MYGSRTSFPGLFPWSSTSAREKPGRSRPPSTPSGQKTLRIVSGTGSKVYAKELDPHAMRLMTPYERATTRKRSILKTVFGKPANGDLERPSRYAP